MSENNENEQPSSPIIPVQSNLASTRPPTSVDYEPHQMTKTEAGVITVIVAGIATAVGFAIRADIKNQEKYAEQMRIEREERDAKAEATRKARTAWFDDQRKGGKVVLELRDGSYLAISNDAYSKAEIKKKGQWL